MTGKNTNVTVATFGGLASKKVRKLRLDGFIQYSNAARA